MQERDPRKILMRFLDQQPKAVGVESARLAEIVDLAIREGKTKDGVWLFAQLDRVKSSQNIQGNPVENRSILFKESNSTQKLQVKQVDKPKPQQKVQTSPLKNKSTPLMESNSTQKLQVKQVDKPKPSPDFTGHPLTDKRIKRMIEATYGTWVLTTMLEGLEDSEKSAGVWSLTFARIIYECGEETIREVLQDNTTTLYKYIMAKFIKNPVDGQLYKQATIKKKRDNPPSDKEQIFATDIIKTNDSIGVAAQI